MTVFIMENVPESLRGICTRFMLEIKAGVFLGTVTAVVREHLWEKICTQGKQGAAMMVYSYPNEQGFLMEMVGSPRRQLVDLDGLTLIQTT